MGKNIKTAKNMLKCIQTSIDAILFFVLHNDGTVDKQFQPSILNNLRKSRADRHFESQNSLGTKKEITINLPVFIN